MILLSFSCLIIFILSMSLSSFAPDLISLISGDLVISINLDSLMTCFLVSFRSLSLASLLLHSWIGIELPSASPFL